MLIPQGYLNLFSAISFLVIQLYNLFFLQEAFYMILVSVEYIPLLVSYIIYYRMYLWIVEYCLSIVVLEVEVVEIRVI